MNFEKKLLGWYEKNKRDLPWRRTSDPYKIWLSEIILQQTRVQQGLSYYQKFITKYPTIKALANANEDEVLKMWQGLGYYSRARNLHSTAKYVTKNYSGNFPKHYEGIKQLKGIGDYTAAAIASFCFGLPHAVVDGNVYRVLSRVFGIKSPIDSGKGKKEFSQLANELLDKSSPGIYNQAIMEFGAMYCTPTNPNCKDCIFNEDCIAYNKGLIGKLPVKQKKLTQKNRYFNYIVLRNQKGIWLEKRTQKDIWQNLFQFPLIETKKPVSINKLIETKEWKSMYSKANIVIKNIATEPVHILSHQKIHSQFIEISPVPKKPKDKNWVFVSMENLEKYAVPRLVDKYLSKIEVS